MGRERLKIGEVAKLAGVGVDAIRFYERRGVLPAASRRASGYREFTAATVERIRFAKKLQALGFTLQEIVELLRTVDAGVATCDSERFRVEGVLDRIDEKISALRVLRGDLARTLRRCREGKCRLLEPVSPTRKALRA